MSKRRIDNNIQEKLFNAELYAYKKKQELLLTHFMELIKIHQRCEELLKQTEFPKRKCIEDVEHVVFYCIVN